MNGVEGDFGRLNPADQARFSLALFQWIDVAVIPRMAGVGAGNLIQMGDRAVRDELRRAPNFDVAGGVVGAATMFATDETP